MAGYGARGGRARDALRHTVQYENANRRDGDRAQLARRRRAGNADERDGERTQLEPARCDGADGLPRQLEPGSAGPSHPGMAGGRSSSTTATEAA